LGDLKIFSRANHRTNPDGNEDQNKLNLFVSGPLYWWGAGSGDVVVIGLDIGYELLPVKRTKQASSVLSLLID